MKLLSTIKRMIGTGADAGYHLANLLTFALAVVIIFAWIVAYLVGWLRGLV